MKRKMLSPATIATVRDTSDLVGLVEETVALKKTGISWKGLCPFHTESTPSFSVTPEKGFWYCFGCSEGGDIIDFVKKRDGLTFIEAVEMLAEKSNITLQYADGSEMEDHTGVSPRRIMKANDEAVLYYRQKWHNLPEQHPGRKLLQDKHFTSDTINYFNVGYAPTPEESGGVWNGLVTHLTRKGYTKEEIVESGLATVNDQNNLYDRFRGRVMWPIYNTAGGCVGFGGRRTSDDKTAGAKYVNTTETAVYHKSELLYNLNHARKNATPEKMVVVVEGYTDVMALHASHIPTAVAACGTAFGEKHAMILKRALGDGVQPGDNVQIVFMFDGDDAGQKAALRAEAIGNVFSAETYAVTLPDNQDPCDVYIQRGEEGLANLIRETKTPLTLFAINHALGSYDVHTPEGTSLALQAAGTILGKTKNVFVRERYREHVGNLLGVPAHMVPLAASSPPNRPNTYQDARSPQPPQDASRVTHNPLDTVQGNPNFLGEEEALLVVIQNPHLAEDWYADVETSAYTSPLLGQLHTVVEQTFQQMPNITLTDYAMWRETLVNQTKTKNFSNTNQVLGMLNKLLVQEPKAVLDNDHAITIHIHSTVTQLLDHDAKRRITEMKRLAANTADVTEQTELLTKIVALEQYRKDLVTILNRSTKELTQLSATEKQKK